MLIYYYSSSNPFNINYLKGHQTRTSPESNISCKKVVPGVSKRVMLVLFEDEDIAVINKYPGLVVHPAGPRRTGTLVNALLFRWGVLMAPGGPDRPGIVHRLDVGTSGLLIVARNEMSYWNLVHQFQERRIGKQYRALVWGIPSPRKGIIDAPIGRHPRHRHSNKCKPWASGPHAPPPAAATHNPTTPTAATRIP